MIKVIAFDYGGVLGCEADDWLSTFKKVLEASGLSKDEMDKVWERHWPKLKVGKEPIDNYWIDAAKKENVNPETLREIYNFSITIDEKVLDFAKELKQNGHRIIIMSNDAVDWMDAKRQRFGIGKVFEKIYCSGNMGIAKPDVEFFKYVLQDLNLKPENLLFIDNQQNNVDAGNSIGVNMLLFTDYSHAVAAIKNSYKNIIRDI